MILNVFYIFSAAGVILTNDATPIETTSTESRGFNDVKTASAFGAGGTGGTISTPPPPLPTVPHMPPTTDMSKYVQYGTYLKFIVVFNIIMKIT